MVLETGNMTSYMDLEDFMEVLDGSNKNASDDVTRPNYEVLLQSLTSLGKLMDKNDSQQQPNNIKSTNPSQDLTADLFSTMSDTEMLNHFMPVRGIDYEQFNYENDVLKKEKEEEISVIDRHQPDDFLPHRMLPQLNPLYKLSSAFKPVNSSIENRTLNEEKKEEEDDDDDDIEYLDEPDMEIRKAPTKIFVRSQNSKKMLEADDRPVREIKKRKPRTYKYNPKPLQHKICRAFVPDELKDKEYWERRKRNNEAAKKSREERRKKELEIMNSYEMMKNEYSQIKIENIRLKARNAVLEKQVTELQNKIK